MYHNLDTNHTDFQKKDRWNKVVKFDKLPTNNKNSLSQQKQSNLSGVSSRL